MRDKQKYLRLFLGVFSVVFFWLFRNYDIDRKNSRWDIHIPEELLDTEFASDFSSQIPVIYIESDDTKLLTDPDTTVYPVRGEINSSLYVYYLSKDNGENTLATIPDQVFDNSRVKIRGRSSSTKPKRPFAIELRDDEGVPVNRQFINFEKESDFVLHAPYMDKSCIKNYFAFTLASFMPGLDYVSEVQPVELIINETGTPVEAEDYQGVYLAIEKIKTGINRVPIEGFVLKDTLEEQLESGGGYIYRRDKYDEGTDTALLLPMTPKYYEYQVYYPKEDELTQEAADMIYQEICFYEDILYNGTFEEFEKYFDVDSFVDMILLCELIGHTESFTGSTYFYRLPGGKLCRGPPWDYDVSLGANTTTFIQYSQSRLERAFLYHPEFLEMFKQRWVEYRSDGGIFSDEVLFGLIDYCVESIGEDALDRNAQRYPELFDGQTYIPANYRYFTSWQEEIQYIKDFLAERLEYLDAAFAAETIETLPGKE